MTAPPKFCRSAPLLCACFAFWADAAPELKGGLRGTAPQKLSGLGMPNPFRKKDASADPGKPVLDSELEPIQAGNASHLGENASHGIHHPIDMPLSREQLSFFHKIFDADQDGKASRTEILEFAKLVNVALSKKYVNMSMKAFDSSQDGKLSFDELFNSTYHQTEDLFPMEDLLANESDSNHSKELKENNTAEVSWRKALQDELRMRKALDEKRFKTADENSDAFLDEDELSYFLYPETHDSSLKLLAEDTLTRRDKNGDGKLTAHEVMQLEEAVELESDLHTEFKKLDKSGDGHLDVHELMNWESGMAHVESALTDLFSDADHDKDGHFSAKELEDSRHKIVGSAAHQYLVELARLAPHNEL